MNLLLLDVRPDPIPVAGPGGLMLLALVVLIITAALVAGFVLLLKQRRRAGSNSASVGRSVSPGATEQTHPSNPNQP
jgi:hypothetical protein